MEKSISYLSRDFNDIKNELISFSKKYYPTLTTDFNDSSVGSWFIDLCAAVGDDLSYNIDRAYQENNINSAKLRSTLLNIARLNCVKVPGPKSSMVEVELTCTVGVDETTGNKPNWKQCPNVKRDTQVAAGSYVFELEEDVNFAEQFNNNGFSNRKFEPLRSSNGAITGYTISKTVMAIAGTSKVYKKVITESELKPFMEIVLPEKNIMSVESIIFKATTGMTSNPKLFEYFIDEEEYQIKNDYVKTYRYYEVESLSDLYRFSDYTNENTEYQKANEHNVYYDYTETTNCDDDNANASSRTTRIYQGKWKPIVQKFITEYTDKGFMKVIFGASSYDKVPSATNYGEYRMSNVMNNSMLGVLPEAGWTMYVLYRIGGGVETNIAIGAINTIQYLDVEFPSKDNDNGVVLNSLKVTNISNALCGKDAPSNDELKNYIKYSIGSQDRCVTLQDYKSKIAMMPPKYGCPFRYNVIEQNNKIVIPILGLTPDKKVDTSLPNLLIDNLREYLSYYKNLTDYVELKSGKVYNLGFEVEVFIDKNYTTEYVIKEIMELIKNFMSVDKHMMGDDIFMGELEKEINKIDGVISLIDLRVYNIWGGLYGSNAKFPLYSNTDACTNKIIEQYIQPKDDNAMCQRIDLEALESVLENDYDSIFEILYPESDICVKCKLK